MTTRHLTTIVFIQLPSLYYGSVAGWHNAMVWQKTGGHRPPSGESRSVSTFRIRGRQRPISGYGKLPISG